MSKPIKISIIAVFLLAVSAILFNPFGWNMPWDEGKTETADAAEAELKKMKDQKAADEKKIAEAIESIDRMQKMIADMNQPPADQIATPVAPAPADSTTAVTPIAKKKSGVGG